MALLFFCSRLNLLQTKTKNMAIPLQLGIPFTSAEILTMKTAIQSVTALIKSKSTFNMSTEEREELSKVGNERLPFALKSVKEYGVDYPNLNGQAYPFALADVDMDNYGQLIQVLTALAEANEVTTEFQMVAGHFCFEFMTDQYDNASKYRDKNVAGAQVVYDGLKDCFAGQGQQINPTPPTP
jgi:hypothetical protein